MPLTGKGEKIRAAMKREYGSEKGERVFYASKNKGTISGVDTIKPSTGVGRAAEISRAQAEHAKRTGGALNRQAAARRVAESTFVPGGSKRR